MKKGPSSAFDLFNLRGLLAPLSGAFYSIGFLLVASSSDAQSSFSQVGAMGSGRSSHTATLLGSGKVLIAGGYTPMPGGSAATTKRAELFDPATGIFTPVSDMTSPRDSHTATLLPNGKVLITGGLLRTIFNNVTYLSSAELFDPATASFTPVASMSAPRQRHTATLLGNGKVLIVGGDSSPSDGTLNTAELFDSETGTFTSLPNPMSEPRTSHTATLLPSGKILIAGGYKLVGPGAVGTNTAELLDPVSGIFTSLAPNTMTSIRLQHTATLLPNGKVLITGGSTDSSVYPTANTAELFDPSTGTFTLIASIMTSPRSTHTATLLPNGKVLLTGGYNGGVGFPGSPGTAFTNAAESFDPVSETFLPLPPMTTGRALHTATLLTSGEILIVGGINSST
jgi:WD40 repeat protein